MILGSLTNMIEGIFLIYFGYKEGPYSPKGSGT